MSMMRSVQLQLWGLLIIILVLAAVEVVVVAEAADEAPIAKRGCNDTCGDVSIPFPFGMGEDCFSDKWFEIECKSNKPFLSKFSSFEVMEVLVDYEIYGSPGIIVGIPPLNVCVAETPQQQKKASMNLTGSPYIFSPYDNVFTVEGCSGNAVLRDQHKNIVAGCGTLCQSNNTAVLPNNSCYGLGCCQTGLSSGSLSSYHIDAYLQDSSGGSQDCIVATLIERDSANQYAGKLSSSDPFYSSVPVLLFWRLTSQSDYDSHASCSYDEGSFCYCNPSYYGNPYVSNGCQVPEECKRCRRGYCYRTWDYIRGRPIPNSYYCEKKSLNLATILG